MNRLQELQKKLNEAIMRQQYTKVAKIQKQIQIEKQRKERVALNTILPHMDQKQTEEALMKMHKMFVTADLLYGFAMDFESCIRRYDPSMETFVVKRIKEIQKISREITRNVDAFNCEELSETFGNMSDEAGMVLENVIYKYRQRDLKKKLEREKTEQS